MFSVTLAAWWQDERGDLRVIYGETLLQKLSDWSRANLNFAAIAAHRTDVPLRHAWRPSFPAARVAEFRGVPPGVFGRRRRRRRLRFVSGSF